MTLADFCLLRSDFWHFIK